jgi:hypothetical protein
MKPKKPKVELLTQSALADRYRRDRRTVSRLLADVKPDAIKRGRRLYRVSRVAELLTVPQDRAGASPALREAKLREEIRKLRTANDRTEQRMVARQKVQEAFSKTNRAVEASLRQRLENEYPTGVAGLEPAQARVYGKRLVDLCISDIRACARYWDF